MKARPKRRKNASAAEIERARKKYYSASFQRSVKAKARKAVASAKRSGDFEYIPSEAEIMQAYERGAKSLNEALEMAGGRRINPAKFDRCVKDVKRKGGAANAYAVCTAAGTRKKKRNPAPEAAQAYEDFHGKPVEQYVEVTERIHTHAFLASAGELKRLEVAGVDGYKHVIAGFDGALLAFNERRNQLFIKGGDQTVNLEDFGIDRAHELETLGQVIKIDYFADKRHLGSEGGKAIYRHKFRTTNENGQHVTIRVARCPDLIYRVMEKRLEFSGGSYEILPEGIDR